MTPAFKEKLMDAIQDDVLYDFIATHYHEMTKEELKDVCLEAVYALGEACESCLNPDKVRQNFLDEVDDRIYADEEDE